MLWLKTIALLPSLFAKTKDYMLQSTKLQHNVITLKNERILMNISW